MPGNWTSVVTDDSTSYGVFDGSDTSINRDHDDVINELTQLDTGATDPGDITYDDAGNIDDHEFPDTDVDEDFLYRYTHDAWNRLVKVEYVSVDHVKQEEEAVTRGEYEYNGLHHRVVRRTDTDLDGTVDQRRDLYYSADWQIIDEDVWDGWSSGSPGSIDRNINYLWGLRGIDDIVVRRTDTDGDGAFDFVLSPAEEVDYYYHLDDVQGTTVAQLDEAAEIVERTSYTSYGVAQHHPKYDVRGDGDRGVKDIAVVAALADIGSYPSTPTVITDASYRAEADLDRDGDIDTADYNLINGMSTDTGIPAGELSPDTGAAPTDNILGFHGYCFNNETQQYAVRYRCYDPQLGRFITRDPAGYVDGASLYEFVRSSPIGFIDPMGLMVLEYLYQIPDLPGLVWETFKSGEARDSVIGTTDGMVAALNPFGGGWLPDDYEPEHPASHAGGNVVGHVSGMAMNVVMLRAGALQAIQSLKNVPAMVRNARFFLGGGPGGGMALAGTGGGTSIGVIVLESGAVISLTQAELVRLGLGAVAAAAIWDELVMLSESSGSSSAPGEPSDYCPPGSTPSKPDIKALQSRWEENLFSNGNLLGKAGSSPTTRVIENSSLDDALKLFERLTKGGTRKPDPKAQRYLMSDGSVISLRYEMTKSPGTLVTIDTNIPLYKGLITKIKFNP